MTMAGKLARRIRLTIAIVLSAGLLGMGGYLLYEWRVERVVPREAPLSLVNPPPQISPVTLKLGQAVSLEAPECRGGDRAHVIRDGQGRIWVFLAQMDAFQFSTWKDGGFSPLAPMPAVADWGAEMCAVALTDGDLPVVCWQTFGPPGTVLIVSSRWSAQGWSPPETLDSMPTPGFIMSFDSLRDASGRTHLVYNRNLDPPEEYKKSPIVMDAVDVFRPGKAFHVYLEKGSWSRPVSTTGPGQFDLREFHLSLDCDGNLCLSGIVRRGSGSVGAIGRQFWRNGTWSDLRSLTPTSELDSCWVYFDLLGITHIWSNRDYAWWRYQQLSNGQMSEMPLPCKMLRPVIKRLPGGRIALLTQGKLTVWNGQEWSPAIDVDAEDMAITSARSILVWSWRQNTVRIQDVLLEEMPGSP